MKYILTISLLLLTSCQKQVNTTPTTPFQKLAVYNGVLAEANRAVTMGVISLQKTKTLTVQQTTMVLDYTGRVANISNAIAVIQQSSNDWTIVSTQVQIILLQLPPPLDISKYLQFPKGQSILTALTSLQDTIRLILQEVKK
jgi:hypothetical protein